MASQSQMPTNFPEMINKVQAELNAFGNGPHSDAEKEKIKTLQLLLSKAKQENLRTPLPAGQATVYQQPSQPKPQLSAPNVITVEQRTSDMDAVKASPSTHKVLDKQRLQDLVKEVDPMAQLEDDVEEVLMQIADDFIENVVSASCEIAKHRHSDTLEVKDVQLHLDRAWHMWVPGFSSDELKAYKKAPATEAHKQRLALIKKALKKS